MGKEEVWMKLDVASGFWRGLLEICKIYVWRAKHERSSFLDSTLLSQLGTIRPRGSWTESFRELKGQLLWVWPADKKGFQITNFQVTSFCQWEKVKISVTKAQEASINWKICQSLMVTFLWICPSCQPVILVFDVCFCYMEHRESNISQIYSSM